MFEQLGHTITLKTKRATYALGFFSKVLIESFLFMRRKQVGFRVLVMQILFTGFEALSVISLISLAIGAVIIIQGNDILPLFGQGDLIYAILITIITRELGPLLTAFIIVARSGTAIATELGQMVVSHQIEAYLSVGIDPISYLVVPRFLGVTISILILNIYFNFVGLFGSFFVAQLFQEIPLQEYFRNILQALTVTDITSSFIKCFIFGIIISTISTYQGFSVKVSSTEVPQVAIKAVGQSFVLVLIADIIITIIYRI